MKKVLLFLVMYVCVSAVMAQGTVGADQITWDKTAVDLGSIKQNVPRDVEFTVTNKSMVPLIISNVEGSCGCTVPSYSKAPVPPGKSTVIKATYNAANLGSFNKTVTVHFNTDEGRQVLELKGTVVQ